MPGVASIKWTEENMVQALHALIYYGAVKIEDEVAEQVAAHLGNGCTTTAIHNLIRTRKASFKPGVLPAPANNESSPAKGRKRKNASEAAAPETPKKTRKTTKKAAKKAPKQVTPEPDSDDENENQEEPVESAGEEEIEAKIEDDTEVLKTEE